MTAMEDLDRSWRRNCSEPCASHMPDAVCVRCCCQRCKVVPCECGESDPITEVTKCGDCPAKTFIAGDIDGYADAEVCGLDGDLNRRIDRWQADRPDGREAGEAPDWCRLREAPITIRLKVAQ